MPKSVSEYKLRHSILQELPSDGYGIDFIRDTHKILQPALIENNIMYNDNLDQGLPDFKILEKLL